jgi:hypothetical protein
LLSDEVAFGNLMKKQDRLVTIAVVIVVVLHFNTNQL